MATEPAADQPSPTAPADTPPETPATGEASPTETGKSASDYNVYLGPFVFTPRGSLILILIISVGINLLLILVVALVALIKAGKL